MTSKSVGRLH